MLVASMHVSDLPTSSDVLVFIGVDKAKFAKMVHYP